MATNRDVAGLVSCKAGVTWFTQFCAQTITVVVNSCSTVTSAYPSVEQVCTKYTVCATIMRHEVAVRVYDYDACTLSAAWIHVSWLRERRARF